MNRFKHFIEKHSKKLIIFLSAVVLILGLLNLFFILEINVTSNDECLWVPKTKGDSVIVYFRKVKVNGVAWKAGIRDDDQLLEINKVPAAGTNALQAELNKFDANSFVPYKIKNKEGEVLDIKVQIKKLISFPQLGLALLGLFWLVIGFVVVMAKPDGYIQRLFFKIGVAFILGFTLILFNATTPVVAAGILDIVWSSASCFLPFLIVKFFWTFPNPRKFMQKKAAKKLLFYIPLSIFILSYIYRVFIVYPKQQVANQFYPVFAGMLLLLLVIAAMISLVSLFISYFRIKDRKERKPLIVILFFYTLALASIFYSIFIAPAISDTIFNSPEYYAPVILIALLPVSFGYSIFRYQLMDVSVVIKNTIVYGAATLSVAIIYFLIIYVLGQTISTIIGTQYQGIVGGVVFILFAVVFQSTKDKFQDFLTEKFYPEQFAYQRVLISFINDISTYVGLETILDSMKKTFVHGLRLNQFGIMIRENKVEGDGYTFHLERGEGISKASLMLHSETLHSFIEAKQKVAKLPVIEREDFINIFPVDQDKLISEGIYTIIPMIIKSKVVGLLLFGLKYSGSQFGGKDLELLNTAANQAAVSIENARLYKSESEKIRIERDLDLARKIQQGLLPQCIPSMNGLDICGQMVPAMQVGGDYFDLIKAGDSQIFVVVGDVSGKGLSAALYMTKLQTMIQLACTPGKTPKNVLVDINKRMYESMERSWFVTMTLALFDTNTNTVKFCRAGHMPILISKNGTVSSHKTQGIGVGLERGPIFEKTLVEEEVKLSPGQVYTFFSDGITEAMNEDNDLFSEEKLIELLKNKEEHRSSQILQKVWDELITHRGKAEQNDDMTMVVVKIN